MSRVKAVAWMAACLALVAGCSGQPGDSKASGTSAMPDWSGVWGTTGIEAGIDGFPQFSPEVTDRPRQFPPLAIFNPDAPLKPEVRAAVQAELARTRGDVARSPEGNAGWGYPLMMASIPPLQFMITPSETLIFNSYRDMRRIITDGRPRPPVEDRWPPTTWGDSVGTWEGDTLVIETIDVREPRKYFGLSLPFSSKARYTERLRRTGPDRIEGELVIEDPEILEAPMRVPLAFRREPSMDRLVLDAFSVDRTGFDGEFNTIEPPTAAVQAGP